MEPTTDNGAAPNEALKRILDVDLPARAVALYLVEQQHVVCCAVQPGERAPQEFWLDDRAAESLTADRVAWLDHGLRTAHNDNDRHHLLIAAGEQGAVLFDPAHRSEWSTDIVPVLHEAVSGAGIEAALQEPSERSGDTASPLAALIDSFATAASAAGPDDWAEFTEIWFARIASAFGAIATSVWTPADGGYKLRVIVYADGTRQIYGHTAHAPDDVIDTIRQSGCAFYDHSQFTITPPIGDRPDVLIVPESNAGSDNLALIGAPTRWSRDDVLSLRTIAIVAGQAHKRIVAERIMRRRSEFGEAIKLAGSLATRTTLANRYTTLEQVLGLMARYFQASAVLTSDFDGQVIHDLVGILHDGRSWSPGTPIPGIDTDLMLDAERLAVGHHELDQRVFRHVHDDGEMLSAWTLGTDRPIGMLIVTRQHGEPFTEMDEHDLQEFSDLMGHVRQRLVSDGIAQRQLELDGEHRALMRQLTEAGHDDQKAFTAFCDQLHRLGADFIAVWRSQTHEASATFELVHQSATSSIGDVPSALAESRFEVPFDGTDTEADMQVAYHEWPLDEAPDPIRSLLATVCPAGPRIVIAVRSQVPTDEDETDWLVVTMPGSHSLAEAESAAIIGAFAELAQRHARVRAEAWFETAYSTAPVAISLRDADGCIIHCNEAYETLTGRTLAELLGTGRDFCTQTELPADLPPANGMIEFGAVYVRPSGELRIAQIRATQLLRPGTSQVSTLSFIEDITERRRNEDQLEYQASHDDLTSLANRRALLAELERTSLSGTPYAVMLIDLDRFKVVNDSLGHSAGDQMLVTCADRLRLALRPDDSLARLGGDEFAVVVRGEDAFTSIDRVAERLLGVLRQPIWIGSDEVFATASIGIAFPSGDDTVEDVLRHADAAMYEAKADGRDGYVEFDSTMRTEISERMRTETELRRAQDKGQLEVFYQPEIDLATGRLVGAEALLRWHHPRRGLLSAGEFIGVIEDTGAVVDIGAWVLETACNEAATWCADGHEVMLRVNVSARQLRPALVNEVAQALHRSGLPARLLCLEITESAVMRDPVESAQHLASLRGLGLRIAVDDFGTGFSSLAYLQRFDVDVLKIDRAFVDDVATGGDDTAIVESIVSLASALDLEVVAEGIETAEQLDTLRSLGCHTGQGWLWSAAVPADEFRGGIQRAWAAAAT